MTPSQIEHLRLIDTHLERLLNIAAKRTPGEWEHPHDLTTLVEANEGLVCGCSTLGRGQKDAAFIASAAGNAEAGWRATRNVIAAYWRSACDAQWHGYLGTAVEEILAAFPLESLKT